MELKKYIYLYKITLIAADNLRPLYYIGIRVCKCLPEDDSYMGSPKTHKAFWKDDNYIKTKQILEYGLYEECYERMRDKETLLIEELWNKFGVFGSNDGQSLNARAGKIVHRSYLEGSNNPSKRPEVRKKISEQKKREYEEGKHNYLSEESKAKSLESRKRFYKEHGCPLTNYWKDKPNPSTWPGMKERKSKKMIEFYKDPENLKKLSERVKKGHVTRKKNKAATTMGLENYFD